MKYKAQDIIEFIVSKDEYTKKKEKLFNLSEWYGFEKNDGSLIRAKYISMYDKNGNYNVYQGKLKLSEAKAIAIINFKDNIVVYDIESFDANKIVINIHGDRLNVEKGDAKERDSLYKIDTTILENIKMINGTIYGIEQRVFDT